MNLLSSSSNNDTSSSLSRDEQIRASEASKPAFSAMTAFSALFLESTLFWSGLLLAVTIMLCSEARAQARSNGSPTGQKSPERSVPASDELLKKALKNAKAVTPDDALERAEVRPTETKTPQPPAQPKLLPDSSSLPDSSHPNSQKQTPLTASKESAAKPEAMKQDKGRDVQSGDPVKPADRSDPSVWEPTGITVSRLFLATDGANGGVRKVPMNVPVLYESRLMALDKDKQRAVARLLDKLVSYRTRLAAMRKEGADLLVEWNQIVSSSTPQDLLLSDSPTLIEKESDDVAGHRESVPGFEPGKGVSIQVKSTAPNQ
jgi:hypothetical protein